MALFTKKTENKKEAPKAASASVGAGEGKILSGVVVSTKMKDTVVVKVDRFVKASKYERFMKISKKYKAHDAGNTKKVGDRVTITETRPISKDKRFVVTASN
ncbi:MAG TPA: 30S ribosomal protein S17 [Candidatus Paceibacterota bacterium]|nr:30S ribosomal protein S17 [Candidatus Paceibacterota bacterium]